MKSHWITVGPKSNDWYLYKKRKGHAHRERRQCEERGREIRVIQLPAKECQGLPEATRNQEKARKDSSLGSSEGALPCLHLISDF